MVHDALFEQDGARLVPQPVTRGGWSDDAQHGSPPCGILARAIELVPTARPMQVVRFTVDLFRAVPLQPLTIDTDVARDGRRVQVVSASLLAGETEVGRATALKIRVEAVEGGEALVGNAGADSPPGPGPEELDPLDWRGFFGEEDDMARFHLDGVEIRSIDDSFAGAVAGRSWFRLRCDLVAGETMTPFQRAATMADLANGNSQALDPRKWLYVNPDINLYLQRLPEGEWIGMHSVARQTPQGIGVTESAVYDLQGRIGSIGQAQILAPR